MSCILDITKDELVKILNSCKKQSMYFDEKDKKKVLSNQLLAPALVALNKRAEVIEKLPNECLDFCLFRRFSDDGNRTDFEARYFLRREKLLIYAIKAWLYDKEEDIVRLMDVMWSILDEYTWSLPAHLRNEGLEVVQGASHVVDLFAAETAEALSEILGLLSSKIHPIVIKRINYEIERRIFSQLHRNDFFWKTTTNNWSAVCSGSVGMAAIYQIEENDRLADILLLTFKCLKNFLRGFSEDGVCLEGISYWHYGFGYFINFAELLKKRTNGLIDLFKIEKVHKVALFYPSVFFEGNRTVSFSDSHSFGKLLPGYVAILSDVYSDFPKLPSSYIDFAYYSDGCARFATSLRQLVYAPEKIENDIKVEEKTYLFNDAQWFISTSKNGVSLAAKGGFNDEPHNHNDVGSFQIFKNGEQLIADIGSGEYTRQYFSAERYSIFCNSSKSHSVPVINGQYQKNGREHKAYNTEVLANGIKLDIAKAYDIKELSSLFRTIEFNKENGQITLCDRFLFDDVPSSVTECFVTEHEPLINDSYVLIFSNNEKLKINYDSNKYRVEVEKVLDKSHKGKERFTFLIKFDCLMLKRSIDAKFVFEV